jgi:DNA-nicking Smr family endonuclease
MAPRRPKHLSGEDRDLWQRIAETVTPLKRGAASTSSEPEIDEPNEPAKPSKPVGRLTPVARAETAKPAPSLAPIDKKLTRRIGRGSRGVDAKIDLHGLTQREAHARLLAFLEGARARGHRLVLVVTGKGRVEGTTEWWEEGTRGVLRRAVPEWLATPPFRSLVVGYERAHLRKGGDGAIYVQLRRDRAMSRDEE